MKRMHGEMRILVGLCLGILSQHGKAQFLPDAGRLLRDVEQKSLLELPLPKSDVPIAQEPATPQEKAAHSIKFFVRSFRISGNTRFSNGELLALIQPIAGSERTLGEIEEAITKISQHYWKNGYPIAHAYIPPQDIKDGSVEIAVLEGRYGRIMIENTSRTKKSVLENYLNKEQEGQAILNGITLQRRLNLLKELTGSPDVSSALKPGETSGTTDLIVRVGNAPSVTGKIETDNYGVKATGKYRFTGSLAWNNPLGRGDRADIKLLTSGHGQDYLRVAYGIPAGNDGWRINAAHSATRYRIGGAFENLRAYGDATVWSASATYPFIRSKTTSLTGEISADHKKFNDHIDLFDVASTKTANVAALGLTGQYYTSAGGTALLNLRFESGHLTIAPAEIRIGDALTANTQGSYDKLVYALAYHHFVGSNTMLSFSFSGQQASKNLDSSEKLSLGGPSSVRAFPMGEASGDAGHLGTVQIRYRLHSSPVPGHMSVMGFMDGGMVRNNINPFSAGTDNTRYLAGTGFGITWAHPSLFEAQLLYAMTLVGDAPSRSSPAHRMWLNLSRDF